jgi:Ca2+:H+ antiporter
MSRLSLALLAFVPVSILGARLGLPGWLVFFVSLVALVPLAALIAEATDQIALRQGPRVGGLLSATFGNVPDVLVGYYGVRAGLIGFVKATLIGGLISNSGFIVGLSFLVAGLRYGFPRFDARDAGHHSILLILAVSGMLLPTVAFLSIPSPLAKDELSLTVSLILLVAYLAYLAFSVFGLVGRVTQPAPADAGAAVQAEAAIVEPSEARWPVWLSVAVLLGATALLAPVTDALVGAVNPTIKALGWTDVFAGMVFVANASNAAELYTAVTVARAGRLDLSLSVASGGSIQIATFVTPLVVLISLFFTPMDLGFTATELAIVGVVVAIFSYVAHDGETNWLEGFQLLAVYVMSAAVFYFLPGA